jgi:hypothetical protein
MIRVGLAVASIVIAWLCLTLVGFWIPRVLGDATLPVLAFLLGALVYRDLLRRDRGRPAAGRSTGR